MSTDTTKPGVAPNAAAPATPGEKLGDGFLSTLADLESRLGALKNLHEQASTNAQTIAQREQELVRREAEINQRLADAETKSKAADEAVANAAAQRAKLEDFKKQIEQSLEASRTENTRKTAELEAALADVQRRQAALTDQETAARTRADAAEHELSTLKEAAAKREHDQHQRQAALLKQAQDLENAKRECEKRVDDAADRERHAAAQRVKAESLAAQAQSREDELTQRAEELELAEKTMKDRADAALQREQKLAEQAKAIAADREADANIAAQRERTLRELENELHEREINLGQTREEIERERASVAEHARTLAEQMKRADDESAAAIWTNRLEVLQLQLGEVAAARAGLETELVHTKDDVESLTQELLEATKNRGVPQSELDAKLTELGTLSAQLEEAQALAQMSQGQIDSLSQNVKAAEAQAAEAKRLFDAAKVDADARDAMRQREAEQLATRLSKLETELSNAQDAAKSAQAAVEAARSQAAQSKSDGDAATDLLAEAERKLAEHERQSATITAALAEARQRAESSDTRLAAFTTERATVETAHAAELSALHARLDAAEANLRAAQQNADESAKLAAGHAKALDKAAGAISSATAKADKADAHAANLAARITELEAGLNAAAAASAETQTVRDTLAQRDERIADLETRLTAALSVATSASAQVADEALAAAAAAATLVAETKWSAMLADRDATIAQRDTLLAKHESTLSERETSIAALTIKVSSLTADVAAASSMVSDAEAAHAREAADLKAALALASEHAVAKPGVDESVLADRDQAIAVLTAEVESLKTSLAEASAAQAVESTEANSELQAELDKREQAIVILKDRLDQALAGNAELTEQIENLGSRSSADVSPAAPSFTNGNDDRRERLRKYKGLLQTQARKILAAQSALQRRHTECETVLGHRQKLVSLAQELSRIEKRVGNAKARTSSAAATLYIVATLCVLAIMSWEVSRRVWPGTYIARAVFDADTGRRTPQPEELQAWQKDNTAFLTDPRTLEAVAERMGRRGFESLSNAIDLKNRLDKDLYVQASKPGSLTVELRGEGAEKTAAALDTLVTGFKSVSDQMRGERASDIGLVITQAATAGAEPLLDKRLEKAASVFGGGLLAVGLAGMVIWSRLVKGKRRFEQAQAVEAALNDIDWATLEATIKKPSNEKH